MEKYDKRRIRMQIVTYKDPFKIDKNDKLWRMMQKYPQLCASDTLAQGLAHNYDRCSFQYLRAIEYVLKALYGKWTHNPVGDMKIYLRLSTLINEMIEDETERRVFRNNIQHVLESIKLLLIWGIKIEEFPEKHINRDQYILLMLYKELKKENIFNHFYPLCQLKREDLVRALKLGVVEEILYETERQDYLTKYYNERELIEAARSALQDKIKEIEQKKHRIGLIKNKEAFSESLDQLNHLNNLLDQDLLKDNKIIIHGIHRINPIIYFFFEQLEKQMQVEPIFVFNYCEEYPHIYETWKKVYEWTDESITLNLMDEELDISPIGYKLGAIIEGKEDQVKLEEELVKFANLTNFTNTVATVYDEAYQKVHGDIKKTLSNMQVQYYVTNANKSNNMLKMYYPEQFGERQFLAYPVGQFILALYNMWDFETDKMKINTNALEECLNADILFSSQSKNVLRVYEKVKIYFQDIIQDVKGGIEDYIERIDHLNKQLDFINKDEILKSFSFFSISSQELQLFKEYILKLQSLTNILFKEMKDVVRYDEHFKDLISTMKTYVVNNKLISEVEKELMSNISHKLEEATTTELEGLREDLNNAIFLYLAQRKEEGSSRWIVRGFEQLDGAVLLSKSTKAQKYHIGLVSENNMSVKINDELSWPLTEGFLANYKGAGKAVDVMLTVLKQRRNFMKYSLFYILAFSKKPIELGYILEEGDEIHSPYFLLKLLGLKERDVNEHIESNLPLNAKDAYIQLKDIHKKISKEQQEHFAICPYKFFLLDGIHVPLIYTDEFQMRYLLSNYIQINIQHGVYSREQKDEIRVEMKELFPFWDDVILNDAIQKGITQSCVKGKADKRYTRRKKNFLIARWLDQVTEEQYMDFEFEKEYFDEYMEDPQINIKDEYTPHEKICECCNLEEICLMNYYWNQE